ncbi:MAG: hypothetical protein M1833_001776 [Piccolia ochrophora]|nr:MAG: hypothetical protein M1833_001776 [Piccolia ochrophora]
MLIPPSALLLLKGLDPDLFERIAPEGPVRKPVRGLKPQERGILIKRFMEDRWTPLPCHRQRFAELEPPNPDGDAGASEEGEEVPCSGAPANEELAPGTSPVHGGLTHEDEQADNSFEDLLNEPEQWRIDTKHLGGARKMAEQRRKEVERKMEIKRKDEAEKKASDARRLERERQSLAGNTEQDALTQHQQQAEEDGKAEEERLLLEANIARFKMAEAQLLRDLLEERRKQQEQQAAGAKVTAATTAEARSSPANIGPTKRQKDDNDTPESSGQSASKRPKILRQARPPGTLRPLTPRLSAKMTSSLAMGTATSLGNQGVASFWAPQSPSSSSSPPAILTPSQPIPKYPVHGQPVPGYPAPVYSVPGYYVPGYPMPGYLAPGYPVPGRAAPVATAPAAPVSTPPVAGQAAPRVRKPRRRPDRPPPVPPQPVRAAGGSGNVLSVVDQTSLPQAAVPSDGRRKRKRNDDEEQTSLPPQLPKAPRQEPRPLTVSEQWKMQNVNEALRRAVSGNTFAPPPLPAGETAPASRRRRASAASGSLNAANDSPPLEDRTDEVIDLVSDDEEAAP